MRFTVQLYGTVDLALAMDALHLDDLAHLGFKFSGGKQCGIPGCLERQTTRVKRHVMNLGDCQFFLCAKHVRRTDKAHPVKPWR